MKMGKNMKMKKKTTSSKKVISNNKQEHEQQQQQKRLKEIQHNLENDSQADSEESDYQVIQIVIFFLVGFYLTA